MLCPKRPANRCSRNGQCNKKRPAISDAIVGFGQHEVAQEINCVSVAVLVLAIGHKYTVRLVSTRLTISPCVTNATGRTTKSESAARLPLHTSSVPKSPGGHGSPRRQRPMWNLILHILGIEPRTPSTAYNWWSGAGSDIGEVAIIGGITGLVFRHNCHQHGCWRLSRHTVVDPTTGEHIVRCRKHHEEWKADGAPTA